MSRVFPVTIHIILAGSACIATLALMAWYAPFEVRGILHSYLIFFVHLPSAFNYLAFFLLGGSFSILYLVTRDLRWDVWAASAFLVSLLACTIAIATGSPWARAAWGHWWIWSDPRLLTVAISWFFLAGYPMLRWSVPEMDRRARYAAVFGIVACLNVPAVHFSIRVIGSKNHPMDVGLSARVWTTVWVGVAAFFLVYLLVLRLAARVEGTSRSLEEFRRVLHET